MAYGYAVTSSLAVVMTIINDVATKLLGEYAYSRASSPRLPSSLPL